jgi:isopenicillin N synthase-like dioxygenase
LCEFTSILKLLSSNVNTDSKSVCQARVTHAPPVGEHTDFGSVTVLFNQLGGLQALEPNSREWKYVPPQPGCAIINLGDAFVKLCGNKLYSAVHRVMGPPGQQAQSNRHSAVYFARPNSDVLLRSLFEDPKEAGEEVMNADAWVANRARTWNSANYKDRESYKASRGTEHNREKDIGTLDKPAQEVEAV